MYYFIFIAFILLAGCSQESKQSIELGGFLYCREGIGFTYEYNFKGVVVGVSPNIIIYKQGEDLLKRDNHLCRTVNSGHYKVMSGYEQEMIKNIYN